MSSTQTTRPARPTRRARRLGILGALATAAVAAGSIALTQPGSAAPPEPPPIQVQPLGGYTDFIDAVGIKFKRQLAGQQTEVMNLADPGRMLVARVTLQPGAQFPWHTHPGPVIVNVVEGDLVYQSAADCIEREYAASAAFLEPGPTVHTAWNPSAEEETVLIGVFFGVPEGGSPTIPSPDQGDRCG